MPLALISLTVRRPHGAHRADEKNCGEQMLADFRGIIASGGSRVASALAEGLTVEAGESDEIAVVLGRVDDFNNVRFVTAHLHVFPLRPFGCPCELFRSLNLNHSYYLYCVRLPDFH